MKKSFAITTILLLLLPLGCNTSHPSSQPSYRQPTTLPAAATADQPFDYYLLNLSWSPEFCYSHPTAVECAQHRAFTLHGLWPQNSNGTYPQNCSNTPGPRNPGQYNDLYPDTGLLRHEWRTHGTCSGLSPDVFFNLARKAVNSITIPTKLASLDHQISLPPNQILDLFTQSNPDIPRDSLALSCGNNYLTAVEICLDKNLHPTSCGPIRTCRANTVRIPPPQKAGAF